MHLEESPQKIDVIITKRITDIMYKANSITLIM